MFLRESDASSALGQVLLPTDESIQTSLFNARFLGRKLYLIGTSILRNIEGKMISFGAEYGVVTINLCRGGDFFENFKKLDLSVLKDANKDDIIIIHASGNNML